ncbi:antiviral reverse transcriptase Drt3b [Burkholderia gladioli pv. alliicola]|uniref:antiviral reverse transcriptase Drt3b n=1 Tax=Burkholderia gladioli TaxID=28095 RepID=UPI002ABC2834|nr:antiviral reverse transcriptase Drt3b [Burkholderia gladioli]MDZ4036863.1 antiviral reverse transcriptase Drt3b [Burkholderia gladioli pv. alliicola]
MTKKALSINFPIERVILSDVLPYEIPIVCSNRYYYRFLISNVVKFSNRKISWLHRDECLDRLMKMIFGIKVSRNVRHETREGQTFSILDLDKKELSSVPFLFSTTHKQDQLRQLSLMHPKGQLMVAAFYDEFKELIIHYSSKSQFSLRAPTRVAGCTYIDYRSQIEQRDKTDALVEMEGENYENLKSFFVYEKFSNVFKFYESKDHLLGERDFKFLTKFDISGCFDNIYTHSISWAIYGKKYSKDNLQKILLSFPGRFDSLMQNINYNETNGILIGPEVSRIFAEIILQSVDASIKKDLEGKDYLSGKDFLIYRYVDDYFVFHDKEDIRRQIKITLQEKLREYKLSLNNGKEETFSRPIITPISIAKKRISDLLEKTIICTLTYDAVEPSTPPKGAIYIGHSSLITEFKSILATSGVDYSDVLNYSLAIVERKIGVLCDQYDRCERNDSFDKQFSKSIESLLGFIFFVYAVSPKVNTTIKLCRICQRIISFFKSRAIGFKYTSLIYQVLNERTRGVIEKVSDGKGAKIEVMYLLVLMRQLGRNYRLHEAVLAKYFGFELIEGKYNPPQKIDYFSVVTLFFYVGSKVRYSRLRTALEISVQDRFKLEKGTLSGNSEMLHLALDMLACPYASAEMKSGILDCYDIPPSDLSHIQRCSEYWFTKWDRFDFSKELDAKVSQEVY